MNTSAYTEGTGSAITVIDASNLIAASNANGTPLAVPVPFQNSIVLIEDTKIAGTMRVPGIDELVDSIATGSKLRLQREPGNLADSWAIKVFFDSKPIGYVSADCNEVLARLMDGGKSLSAKLTQKEKIGTWNKLHMEVILDD